VKNRCQNQIVRQIVDEDREVILHWRMESEQVPSFGRIVIDFDQCVMFADRRLNLPPFGGDEFRGNALHEKKNLWTPPFKSTQRELFCGELKVNRFIKGYVIDLADRSDDWHWSQLCDAITALRCWAKSHPAPECPKGEGFWQREWFRKMREEYLPDRRAFFQRALNPKVLPSLSYFVTAYGDTPSFKVVGNRADREAYIRQKIKHVNHHAFKAQNRKRLHEELVHAEWDSILKRVKPHFDADAIDELANAVSRAVKRGKTSTAAARAWFEKQNLLSRFTGWAATNDTTKTHT
jgi:hypothetical protein